MPGGGRMIYLLVGQNRYDIRQNMQQLIKKFGGDVSSLDPASTTLSTLTDSIAGGMLFSQRRSVVIDQLSDNAVLWSDGAHWIDRVDEDVQLILVEEKPDKRTKTYKLLAKKATIIECKNWTSRDASSALQWLKGYAAKQGMALTHEHMTELVQRATVTDDFEQIISKQRLVLAMDALSVLDEITQEDIDTVLPPSVGDNVFLLLESALKGQPQRVADIIRNLRMYDDAYRTEALLASQWMQVSALVLSRGRPLATIASDLGVKPFALQKIEPLTHHLTIVQLQSITRIFSEIDYRLKSTTTDPWLLVERLLLEISQAKTHPY